MTGRVLVTGANGFVGAHLCRHLRAAGLRVRGAVRVAARASWPAGDEPDEVVEVSEIGPETDWSRALDGVDAVIHAAARAHVMDERAEDPLREYRRVNVEGTARLAEQAAAAGVRRLVYVSSVKVNGETTAPDAAFREEDLPAPLDPYGISKWEAEQALWRTGGVQAVVVRPPLVYGPGVRANFLRMLRAVERGVPLPLGSVRNRRSLVYVGNLVDALFACVLDGRAVGETFLVSDGPAVSTPELVRTLARGLGRPARLVPVPTDVLRLVGRLVGRSQAVDRLCGSLVVDDGKIRRRLDWTPPYSVEEAMARTARWFREHSATLETR